MKALKWDEDAEKYDDVEISDEASLYEEDMDKVVACANCGQPKAFGECYTSRHYHNNVGFGYAVCPDCHFKETH